MTYPATDEQAMASAVTYVLQNHAEVVSRLGRAELPDTLAPEVALLTT